jgi:hypothetical protein
VGLALATLLGATAAHAATVSGLALPDYIGPLEYLGEVHAHEGVHSFSYRAMGLTLEVDVRDYASGELADGVDSATLKREFAHARSAALLTAAHPGARLIRQGTVQLGTAEQFAAREAVFSVRNSSFHGRTYLWLAAMHGHLLEMHFDVESGFEEDGHVSRGEVLAALGDALARAPPTVARSTPAPRMTVAILWDPATPPVERQLWSVYLYTRAAQAARESEEQELPVGVRAAAFEEELRARRMALELFRDMRNKDARLRSAYFEDLDRVEAAGFLREYVWHYLRSDAWRGSPEGLRLREFEAWRVANIPQHVPVTHGRIALRLASR